MQAAQKLAPVLEFLRRHTGLALQVVLHPESELSDLPLKSYYRFALSEFAGAGEWPVLCHRACKWAQVRHGCRPDVWSDMCMPTTVDRCGSAATIPSRTDGKCAVWLCGPHGPSTACC